MDPNLLIVLLGTMTITSYRPIPAQTKPECVNRYNCTTSIDDGITQYGAAVSQDLLKSGIVHYGDIIKIDGFDTLRVVNDTMNKRHQKHVDLMVFSYAEEHKVGTRYKNVWIIRSKGDTKWNGKSTQQKRQRRAVGAVKVDVMNLSDTTGHSGRR